MSMRDTVGVVGLGIMGGAFAQHLVAAGVRTLGYDLVQAHMDALNAQGGDSRGSARVVAAEADLLITSLPHSEALEDVLFGADGIVAAGRTGILVVETSTLSLEIRERARARLASAGIGMLDAPVSGTGGQAKVKDITILASGDRADFERAHGVLSHLARSVRYVGGFGDGSRVKYIANLLVAVHILAAAEALVLGEQAGLDSAALLDVLTDSAATSRMLEVRGPNMVTAGYTVPMVTADIFQKDLAIISDFARQTGAPVPLFSTCVPYFAELSALGMGGYDTAAVIAVMRRVARPASEESRATD
jgi:3-hydroxyisobutyrate dehydrogenase-like beta-hydroxyacid dehydrogenase